MTETMQLRGTLRGHNGWVTQIATNPIHTDMILSCSRGECPTPAIVGRRFPIALEPFASFTSRSNRPSNRLRSYEELRWFVVNVMGSRER